MRLLKRNCTKFAYRKCLGEQEILHNGHHTGNYAVVYSNPVMYEGNISAPSGYVTDQLFGVATQYTHVLLMADPDVDIDETGLIDWKGHTYEVKAVRPSLNFVQIALKKQISNAADE